jgi:hypothetical protein
LRAVIAAGSTATRTYKLRYGPVTAGTATLLRTNAVAGFFDNIDTAVFTITEILP